MFNIPDDVAEKIKQIVDDHPEAFENIDRLEITWNFKHDSMIFKVLDKGETASYTIIKKLF